MINICHLLEKIYKVERGELSVLHDGYGAVVMARWLWRGGYSAVVIARWLWRGECSAVLVGRWLWRGIINVQILRHIPCAIDDLILP